MLAYYCNMSQNGIFEIPFHDKNAEVGKRTTYNIQRIAERAVIVKYYKRTRLKNDEQIIFLELCRISLRKGSNNLNIVIDCIAKGLLLLGLL